MSDAHIQVPPDSTGKRVDQESITVNGQLVHRPRNVQSDPIDPNGHAPVKASVTFLQCPRGKWAAAGNVPD